MVNIKYTLCAEGQIYGAGESNLKESLGRPLDSNGCTVFLCTAGRAVVFINFQKCVLKRGDVVFLFSDIVFAADKVSNLFSVLYISLPDEAVEETLYKLTSISFGILSMEIRYAGLRRNNMRCCMDGVSRPDGYWKIVCLRIGRYY